MQSFISRPERHYGLVGQTFKEDLFVNTTYPIQLVRQRVRKLSELLLFHRLDCVDIDQRSLLRSLTLCLNYGATDELNNSYQAIVPNFGPHMSGSHI